MPNTQYPTRPMMDWSSEISAAQPAAHASSTTSTTTTTTASASASPHAAAAPQTTTTTTNTNTSATAPGAPAPSAPPPALYRSAPYYAPRNEFTGSTGTLDLETHQPIEVIEAPADMNEAFLGSLKAMLLRNRGNFVTATFLIGTQGTTAWEGILHDVGNDYVIIYQPGRERYIACDIYSLKYIEFYDTKQRDMCERMLRQNGVNSYY